MRTSFWKGVIAGSIIGAAISMAVGGRQVHVDREMVNSGAREARSRAQRVFRGVSRSVNDMMK